MMLENEALPFGDTEGDFSAVDKARVVEALNKVLPSGTLMYDRENLRPYGVRRPRRLPRALPLVVGPADDRGAGGGGAAHLPQMGVPVVARGAGTRAVGRRSAAPAACCCRWRDFNRIVALDPLPHRHGRAAGRAQPGDLRGGRALRAVLRARSVVADRLLDRRQRGRERRRRALPQVRPHGAQPAAVRGVTIAGEVVEIGSSRSIRRATTCLRWSPALRAC